MHKSKGKWRASAKDTWSVESNLSPIILAYLQRLYEELKKSECHGVPMRYVEQQSNIQGIDDQYSELIDTDAADDLRFKDLEELIWVFGSEEPPMKDYDFNTELVLLEAFPSRYEIRVTNQEEYDRYTKDVDAHWERKLKGYKLFGEIYSDLQW